ncbi:branched-chain amino acid ABC transporter substrate-binding protein [Weizmannia acidilactici]|uniref:branched-chain amino acid ABC transporter substrate-binding protein n=1 Tax=Weizmannia acidilactici TaxID=2607726 RepID=UPI00124D8C30|nr:branched-chain amino acid ABC transporter substrate-binding protein [Weizmannia acidilactici]GER67686.1 branched chain amino acid ABC transporter substrate-binding protein [Weizmannia acidilactici]GER73895.1 branched chain amino acid ABC transporter substrate-binding protein [Weizmannia acidilactici]
MKSKKLWSFGLAAVLAVSLLGACSQYSSKSNASGGSMQVIKIATQSPLSGGSATLGEAIKLGAQLALEEQQAKFKKMGFKLQLVPYDDQGDPKKGVSNAQLIGSDDQVFGVIGHLNSGVSIPASEVYEKYAIPMISPASTATEVTDRNLKTVNRVCARDDFQGPAGASYAVKTLKAKKIFVIQDKTAYGQGLADAFKAAAEKLGAKIVGYESITVGEKDFNGVLNSVSSAKPDLVYFGGLYAEGGLIVKQARAKGIDVPIMGGDGLDSSTYVDIAGGAVKNTYLTSVAGDVSKTSEGKKFAENYKNKFRKNVESYSAYAYDAMGVMLKGLENAIKANGGKIPTREQVRDAVRAIKDYKGVVTEVDFDSKGDNKYAKVFIYKFNKAAYPAEQEGEISK